MSLLTPHLRRVLIWGFIALALTADAAGFGEHLVAALVSEAR